MCVVGFMYYICSMLQCAWPLLITSIYMYIYIYIYTPPSPSQSCWFFVAISCITQGFVESIYMDISDSMDVVMLAHENLGA